MGRRWGRWGGSYCVHTGYTVGGRESLPVRAFCSLREGQNARTSPHFLRQPISLLERLEIEWLDRLGLNQEFPNLHLQF